MKGKKEISRKSEMGHAFLISAKSFLTNRFRAYPGYATHEHFKPFTQNYMVGQFQGGRKKAKFDQCGLKLSF